MDSLSYDGWGRLLGWQQRRRADSTYLVTDSVSFDRTGNVYPESESRTYELQTDRLLTKSIAGEWAWSYSYDGAGNLTQASGTKGALSTTWTYGYDALNQLRSVRRDGVLVARYGYDVLGRRIARKVYAVTLPGSEIRETRYLYQGNQVSAETDATGAIKWKYTWGPGTDNLVGVQDSAGTALLRGAGPARQRPRSGAAGRDLDHEPAVHAVRPAPGARFGWGRRCPRASTSGGPAGSTTPRPA